MDLIRTLSVQEWHELSKTGANIPVRILLRGNSMFPLIRYMKDYVTIVPLEEPPKIGDIVLFFETNRNLYNVHRVHEKKDGSVLTWGDNCDTNDGWISMDKIWGKVILIERGRKKIYPDPEKGIKWSCFWHLIGRVYRPGYRIYEKFLRYIIRHIKR